MPSLQIPEKLEKILTTNARIIVVIGGRGSAKSESVARILVMWCQTQAADILCGREFQNSIDDSVHKLLVEVISKTGSSGFDSTDKKIDCTTGGKFRFRGFSRNPEAVKSAQGFKYSWVEESDSLSQKSIDDLLPTIRANDSKLLFTANIQSTEDPFTKRFVTPFKHDLDTHGFYEDEMHLIIFINYTDNPFFPPELELQRKWDYDHLSRAKYDHIWLGASNDSIENGLVQRDWFDSCVDAHLTLGFEPTGAKMSTHDPSDEGSDSKGFVFRHGSVVLDVQEKIDGDVNEGCSWATGLAINHGSDIYAWDCDGMGIALKQQTATALDGKQMIVSMFKGSEGVDFPDAIYDPVVKSEIQDQRTNKQLFKNKRAQYYFGLRDRILRTHRAVTLRIYSDPEKMISFASDMPLLNKLRSEICRMPIKPNANGMFELYTKEAMKIKFKVASPNLADPTMMSMRMPHVVDRTHVKMPQPIRPMGRR